jgi:uncharacterized protein (UPF0548 family)
MFLLTKPSAQQIKHFISGLAHSNYSYRDVGATASGVPPSYAVDHNRVRLGSGASTWSRAVNAIKSWQMFEIGWVRLCWSDVRIRRGCDVAILVQHFGFYSLNGARIVYVVEDDGPTKRFGFAYGTLDDHAESGEERFVVEWDQRDDDVSYDLLAFSKPAKLLSRIAFPLSRMLQKRFAADSKVAMVAFVRGPA